MIFPLRLVTALSLSLLATPLYAAPAPNVILIIGDGFDDQHVTMGRNYLKGAGGKLRLDEMPFRGVSHIETVGFEQQPLYVADSANTATSMATGAITQIGRIGTSADDEDLLTIAEAAMAQGLRAGLVSSASITDATPAAFIAHVSHRGCENPDTVMGGEYYGRQMAGCPADARDNQGLGSIAEQIADSALHVVLGGGSKHFDTPVHVGDQETPAALAQSKGFRVVREPTALDALPAGDRVLGLFASSHLPVRWQGSDGRRAESPQEDGTAPPPMSCEPNPDYGDTPSLSALTEVALERLSSDNEAGFFLMVESASIDKQSHGRNPCGSIGEVAQLEEALAAALEFAAQHENTLVLVTADHAQAAQIVPEPSLYTEGPTSVDSPGKVARLVTPEGSLMRINYATDTGWSENHTGANVPVFGNGVAVGVLRPFMRQRELFDAMMSHLELKP